VEEIDYHRSWTVQEDLYRQIDRKLARIIKSCTFQFLKLLLKRFAAILFLAVLSFNWLGYKLVFQYLENRHNTHLEAKLDKGDYDEKELISIKTASHLPYYNSSSEEFERWDGQIVVNGIQYKYVKRRFYNDSVELLCIPNMTAMKLKEARQDYYRISNDLQSDASKKQDQSKVPAFKNLLNEYCEDIREWDAAQVAVKQTHYSSYSLFISQYVGDNPGQPPDVNQA